MIQVILDCTALPHTHDMTHARRRSLARPARLPRHGMLQRTTLRHATATHGRQQRTTARPQYTVRQGTPRAGIAPVSCVKQVRFWLCCFINRFFYIYPSLTGRVISHRFFSRQGTPPLPIDGGYCKSPRMSCPLPNLGMLCNQGTSGAEPG